MAGQKLNSVFFGDLLYYYHYPTLHNEMKSVYG